MRRELAHQQIPSIPIYVPVTHHRQNPNLVARRLNPSGFIHIVPHQQKVRRSKGANVPGNSIQAMQKLYNTFWPEDAVWAHPRPRPPRPASSDGDNVPVTQQQQNPAGGTVAGGSIPPTSISTDPAPATHQRQQVPTNVVEEQLPSTSSDTNPVTPKQQNPTDVAGDSASDSTNYAGSHSDGAERSPSLQSDDSSTNQQQVHADGVGATSVSGDDHSILSVSAFCSLL